MVKKDPIMCGNCHALLKPPFNHCDACGAYFEDPKEPKPDPAPTPVFVPIPIERGDPSPPSIWRTYPSDRSNFEPGDVYYSNTITTDNDRMKVDHSILGTRVTC